MSSKNPPVELPAKLPPVGYYYNYQHDPKGLINNRAYEVLHIGWLTESSEMGVVYRSLDSEDELYSKNKKAVYVKPFSVFFGEKRLSKRKSVPRNTLVTDRRTIQLLNATRRLMYEVPR